MRCVLSGRGLRRKSTVQFSTFLDGASIPTQYSACTWNFLFVPATDSQSDKAGIQDLRTQHNCYDVILWLEHKISQTEAIALPHCKNKFGNLTLLLLPNCKSSGMHPLANR